jgi:hypothetical protein
MRGKPESIPGIFHVINSCGAQELIIKSVTIRDFWCDFSESCRLIANCTGALLVATWGPSQK